MSTTTYNYNNIIGSFFDCEMCGSRKERYGIKKMAYIRLSLRISYRWLHSKTWPIWYIFRFNTFSYTTIIHIKKKNREEEIVSSHECLQMGTPNGPQIRNHIYRDDREIHINIEAYNMRRRIYTLLLKGVWNLTTFKNISVACISQYMLPNRHTHTPKKYLSIIIYSHFSQCNKKKIEMKIDSWFLTVTPETVPNFFRMCISSHHHNPFEWMLCVCVYCVSSSVSFLLTTPQAKWWNSRFNHCFGQF